MKNYISRSIRKIVSQGNYLLQLQKIFSTRQVFKIWKSIFQSYGCDLDRMVHPLWKKVQPRAEEVLMNNKKLFSFLTSPDLQFMFYRMGFSDRSKFELNYIKSSSDHTWKAVKRYTESSIGGPKYDCKHLNISVNSLSQLYYWAAITSRWDIKQISTIVEIGGGYGCFCRVMLELISPRLTYIIFDLPEMLALQHYFLSASSSDYKVVPHFGVDSKIVEGAINLIPIYFLRDYQIKYFDLFVSTFALSETPHYIQKIVMNKLFSKAKYLYMTIQDTDSAQWNEFGLEPKVNLLAMIQNIFPQINTLPFHSDSSIQVFAEKPVT